MSGAHPDLGPELRQLAQTILDRLDPAVRAGRRAWRPAAVTAPGKCQQVWCPVCALAALASGEQHPLLTVIAEHSVALLTVVRAIIEPTRRRCSPAEPPDGAATAGRPPDGDRRRRARAAISTSR